MHIDLSIIGYAGEASRVRAQALKREEATAAAMQCKHQRPLGESERHLLSSSKLSSEVIISLKSNMSSYELSIRSYEDRKTPTVYPTSRGQNR